MDIWGKTDSQFGFSFQQTRQTDKYTNVQNTQQKIHPGAYLGDLRLPLPLCNEKLY